MNGVRAAAIVVQTTAAANKLLVAYVVGEVNPIDVRAQVAERLPAGSCRWSWYSTRCR